MCELLQRDDMFELEDTITPHKLGLHDPYEIEVGMESPYFVGKKNNGRGAIFSTNQDYMLPISQKM